MYLKLLLIISFVVVIFSFSSVNATETGYCRIGADPVNPGLLLEGEKIYKLPQDTNIKMRGGSGKTYECRLRAGEEVAISQEASSGNWRVVRIYVCGNPVLSEVYAEIPQTPQHTNLRPLQPDPLQQQYNQPAPSLSQNTTVMVQPSAPTGPPMNVSYYGNGGSSYDSNRAYDDYYRGQSSGYGYAPQMFGAAIGTFGAAILGNQYSQPPPPAVIYNDSFNNTNTVINNRRGGNYGRNDRNYRNSGGNSYDSYYSNRGQGGGNYRGGTKYCPPAYRNTNTGNARQDYINQTIRGGSSTTGGGGGRQSYVNQTTRSGGNGRTRR